jgi:hypothetical protein
LSPAATSNTSVISKGWITAHWRRHPTDSEQFRSVPRTQPVFGNTVSRQRIPSKQQKRARHGRHDLEGGPGEAGLDQAFGHRAGGGLSNRHCLARTFVGKRSRVRPRIHRASDDQLATELMPAPDYAAHEIADRRVSTGRSPNPRSRSLGAHCC